MSTSHAIRAHAKEVQDKQTKIKGGYQSGSKVVTHIFKLSDLPQGTCTVKQCSQFANRNKQETKMHSYNQSIKPITYMYVCIYIV